MKAQDVMKPSLETSSEAFLERFLPGTSPSIVRLRKRVAQLNSPRNSGLVSGILILGESGVGKNHLARVLAGHRRWLEIRNSKVENPGLDAPLGAFIEHFDEILLPALPETLIESELFGVKKGAFTGATENRAGLLGGLGGGSDLKDVLLDEIGDASQALQTKLLQVVDQRKFRPVGSREDFETSARLLMATNRNLRALVKEGKFREDLFWRMNGFVVTVPPLREQPENIELIASNIEQEISARMPGTEERLSLSADDIQWAKSYHWPGNVRELRDALYRWFVEEGKVPLRQLVDSTEGRAVPSADSATLIAGLVQGRLQTAIRQKQSVGGLMELVKEFEWEVKHAANAWYRDANPTDDALQRLFPGKKPGSLRNKLSSWRRR
jgi:Nif-specific regulatory protein